MSNIINIRPTSGVYANFKNLRYEPWTAIAEFVDNSTQSFFDNSQKLKNNNNLYKLVIEITYDQKNNKEDVLTIKDNAYGMEWEDFERAVRIDKPPLNKQGRNEFGMGLKTAACWFGNVWTLVSTQLNSERKFTTTIDVNKMLENQIENVDCEISTAKPEEHFTILTIKNLNKKITGSKTISKVKSLLASIYREDLRRGDVAIFYNNEKLNFNEVEIFSELKNDGSAHEWKINVDFSINHDNIDLTVKGFIAIRKKGSLQDSGLTLLRRNRVIIGGLEQNYRPKELFGEGNSYRFQRVFGELHMDNWKVTQAKDNFDWHNEGLEEEFINKLEIVMKEINSKAESIRVRQKINTEVVAKKITNELIKSNIFNDTKITFSEEKIDNFSDISADHNLVSEDKKDISAIWEGPKTFKLVANRKNIEYRMEASFNTNYSKFFSISQTNDFANIKITFNLNHPFFRPLTDNEEFIVCMGKFIICFAISEVEGTIISHHGKVDVCYIRTKINQLLEESLEIKKYE